MQLLFLAFVAEPLAAKPVAHMGDHNLHVGLGYSNGGHAGVAFERQLGQGPRTWAWAVGPVGVGVWTRNYWGLLSTGALSVYGEVGLGARAGILGIGFAHVSSGLQYFPAESPVGAEFSLGYSASLYWNVEQSSSVLDYFYTFPQAGLSVVVSLGGGQEE